jgi:hypothetical protein
LYEVLEEAKLMVNVRKQVMLHGFLGPEGKCWGKLHREMRKLSGGIKKLHMSKLTE